MTPDVIDIEVMFASFDETVGGSEATLPSEQSLRDLLVHGLTRTRGGLPLGAPLCCQAFVQEERCTHPPSMLNGVVFFDIDTDASGLSVVTHFLLCGSLYCAIHYADIMTDLGPYGTWPAKDYLRQLTEEFVAAFGQGPQFTVMYRLSWTDAVARWIHELHDLPTPEGVSTSTLNYVPRLEGQQFARLREFLDLLFRS